MKLLMVIAHEKFRDEEFLIPARVFAEAGIAYDVATDQPGGSCMGMLGETVEVTRSIKETDASLYDGIVIVGGPGAAEYLWADRDLRALVKTMYEDGDVVAAICLAPVVFAYAGILEGGRQATVFKTRLSEKSFADKGAVFTDIPVVVDGTIITANGPLAAAAFAEEIISALSC
ncbi:DJ-1/PfpI family protein [Methanogenium cariaci]|uniref:DJ-1/PfpI family protein n=1 Tax=Methanogenium cariaci TaxID=2197 RepID=UPI0007847188|nr:DJ-1/PfpI family protein [Methanogenium cariaci]